jgi:hypothetical protein
MSLKSSGPCIVKLRFTVLWALHDICFNILFLVISANSVVSVNFVCLIYRGTKFSYPSYPPHPFLVATSNKKYFTWSCTKKSTRSTNDLNCTFNVMVLIFCISCECCFAIKKNPKRIKYLGCFILTHTGLSLFICLCSFAIYYTWSVQKVSNLIFSRVNQWSAGGSLQWRCGGDIHVQSWIFSRPQKVSVAGNRPMSEDV